MKIVFVTATLTSGGSERVISLLANKMAEKGHQIEVICLRKQVVFYPINSSVKITFAAKEAFGDTLPLKIIWLRNYIKQVAPDVVIPFMTAVYCTTIFALLGLNIPIIASERIDPAHSSPLRKILRWFLLPMTTHLVVQTEKIKEYYSSKIQNKTSVIYNPVSDKVFEISYNAMNNLIVSVGRLYPQKNQKMMIDAFNMIKNKYPDYKLIIYGEGPSRKELEDYIKSLSLEEKVLLPGRSEHVIDEVRKSRIFCLSSDCEGMSNALIEALCLGIPIVTTDVSGVEELVIDGINGRVVEIGDSVSMANALNDLLEDKEKMIIISKRNKDKAQLFESGNITDRWLKLINNIIRNQE